MSRSKATIIALISALINSTLADLPIHCLKHQVVGDWKLQVSKLVTLKDSFYMNCGHEAPDNPANSYLALKHTFTPEAEYLVTLGQDSKVTHHDQKNGEWSMIYDEGMDIKIDNHRFTSFFEYYPKDDDTLTSYCGKTVVGWYHDAETEQKACFRAEKVLNSPSEKEALFGTPLNQKFVVQPDSTVTLLQLQTNTKNKRFSFETTNTNLNLGFSLTQLQTYVDKINTTPGMLWTAKVPSDYAGKSMLQLNSMAGRRKAGVMGARPSLKNPEIEKVDVSDLPEAFTWKDYLKEPRQQLDCGSCYVIATIQMLEARLKIRHGIDEQLSVQHVLDCSPHNQGCDGGYPFLVEKYANEYDLVPESCSPYTGKKGSCQKCDKNTLDRVYRAGNYKFIGGSYGQSNERNMMEELMANGPIVASLEPDETFMYYSDGIYHGIPASYIKKGEDKPEWQRVDHSVLLYGWGQDANGEKYWELLNSWGPNWGQNGHFKMKRGVDEGSIESLGEAADVVVINNKKNSLF